jgi:hypothetical protein
LEHGMRSFWQTSPSIVGDERGTSSKA